MKKLYLDWRIFGRYRDLYDFDEEVILSSRTGDCRLVKAGTEILSLQDDPGDSFFSEYAKQTGLHFIFEGNVPEIPFYAVPYLCLFGTDGRGGFFAMKRRPDPEEMFCCAEEPVYYIPGRRRVYYAAAGLEELTGMGRAWRNSLRVSRKIRLYPSMEAAERSRSFAEEEMLSLPEPEPRDMDIPLPFLAGFYEAGGHLRER